MASVCWTLTPREAKTVERPMSLEHRADPNNPLKRYIGPPNIRWFTRGVPNLEAELPV